MMEWDNRMQNTRSVEILKAVIPFFDIGVGEAFDMEGMLGAVRPFAASGEKHIVDMILQFFQMRRMIEMVQIVQSMQQMQSASGSEEGEDSYGMKPGMMDMLKSMVPPDQQENIEMISAMMSMMGGGEQAENGEENESVDF